MSTPPLDEGYIKFDLTRQKSPAAFPMDISTLIKVRDRLHELELIGYYADINIGYGNVSQRCPDTTEFIISGTQTGHLPHLLPAHFSHVTAFDSTLNQVTCKGPVRASSESMTHGMLYRCAPEIGCVLHIHHGPFWQWLMDHNAPTSGADVPYGTPAMAAEIERLFRETNLLEAGILSMGGHAEGVIAFGADPLAAEIVLLDWYRRFEEDTQA
ncbi:MAG: class II aldolase/adducin family protein [Bacteroidota bacterium]